MYSVELCQLDAISKHISAAQHASVNFRYKDAIRECSSALDINPDFAKALTRRAKAYEQMQHYKQALSDIQKANKNGPTAETQVCY